MGMRGLGELEDAFCGAHCLCGDGQEYGYLPQIRQGEVKSQTWRVVVRNAELHDQFIGSYLQRRNRYRGTIS